MYRRLRELLEDLQQARARARSFRRCFGLHARRPERQLPQVQLDARRLAPDEALLQAALVLRIAEEAASYLASLAGQLVRRPVLTAAALLVTWSKRHVGCLLFT